MSKDYYIPSVIVIFASTCYTIVLMLRQGLFLSLFIAPLIIPIASYANSSGNSDVSVQSESRGTSTTCINGKCTSTGGGSYATACINGKCTTSDDGKMDIESDDGHSSIHINNSTNNSATEDNETDVDNDTPEEQLTPTVTPKPTMILNHEIKPVQRLEQSTQNDRDNPSKKRHFAFLEFLKGLFSTLFR